MIYLASPYTDPDPAVRQSRYEAVCKAAAALIAQGETVFSPIAHSHGICLAAGGLVEWDCWADFDLPMISHCEEMVILDIDGWNRSVGVGKEVRHALRLGKSVRLIPPVSKESP